MKMCPRYSCIYFCRAALGLDIPVKNELFATGRMAYVIELDDEIAESDIPTTLLRSRKDCPGQEVCVFDC
jgi:hypothetical protein